MKHKWKPIYAVPAYWPGQQQCTACGITFCAPYDCLDTERVAKFVVKQKARNDCPEKNS